jgi:hypothetical protein
LDIYNISNNTAKVSEKLYIRRDKTNFFDKMKKIILLMVLLCFALGCSKKAQEANNTPENYQTEGKNSPNNVENKQNAAQEDIKQTLSITANGKDFAKIQIFGEKATILYNEQTILLHRQKEDKRKFEVNGNIIAEVKYKDEGFKLRTAEGQLKWKVKTSTDKLKISNNEENNNAFEVKVNDNMKVKVKQNDTEIATATYKDGKMMLNSQNQTFEVSTPEFSPACALLGITTIPAQDRLLLLTTLLMD